MSADGPGHGLDRRPRALVTCTLLALVLAGCAGSAAIPAVPEDWTPLEASIPEIQDAMQAGRITSAGLVDFYLERIAAFDDAGPGLNALIEVNPLARDQAEALDAERAASGPRGPLHGIPVVLKDNINTADLPTTAGALALEGFQPPDDAFQVRKLRDAGAVILAKGNMYDFAYGWETVSSLGGQTLNPYDPSHDPGGSSGGPAVAVTANFAAVGLGTDTCGSVRLPAAHNNLFGLRPTTGLSSRAGVIPLSPTLDTVGPLTRTVVDLAIVLDATVGPDPADPTTVPVEASYLDAVDPQGLEGRRIGVLSSAADAEVAAVLEAALDEMAANGAEVVRDVVLDVPGVGDVFMLLDEFRDALDDYLAGYPEAPVGSLREIVDRGLYRGSDVRRAASEPPLAEAAHRFLLGRRESVGEAVVAFMDESHLDALAYPTTMRPAPQIGDHHETVHCATASMGGLPAMVVPAGFTPAGLPVGLELVGRPFAEPALISIASGYEAHTDHRRLPPTTPALDSGG